MNTDLIVQIARSYIGQKEIPPNAGFVDVNFEKKMRAQGWQTGWAWCALLSKLIWYEASAGHAARQLRISHLCSPSALATYSNWHVSPGGIISLTPALGALAVWKHGTDPTRFEGHMGVVTGLDNYMLREAQADFTTVEGNTSALDPNERNGETTAEKPHHLRLPLNPKGLNLIGFIYPPE